MADALAEIRRALAGRYSVVEEIGRGGMATVYLADDLTHGRKVAVKVLHPDLAAVIGVERFLREIEITARLTHPHILSLYDSGRAGGPGGRAYLYYVMPYIEGETLRDRLDREQQLPLDDALRIAGEVGDALGYAHSYGVVHRDIKPENILLHAGHAVLADFGIARAITEAGGQQLTSTGMAIGTPAYMSPEQSSGVDRIDGRTDVYALGSVLYEMLAGEPPYTGPSPQAVLAKRLSEPVPHVSTLRETIPEHVERAIARALAKAPADRFATAAGFLSALASAATEHRVEPAPPPARRRGTITVAVAALVVGVTAIVVGPRLVRSAAAELTHLAVLPCANRMGDPAQNYIPAGVHDEVVAGLGRIAAVEVRGRNSVLRYRDTAMSSLEIGRALGVGSLVECSVFRSGSDSVRVTVSLRDAVRDRQLWASTYQRPAGEVFLLGSDITRGLADALRASITPTESARVATPLTASQEALVEYHRGRYFATDWGEENLARGVEHFERAIALDSTFALAYIGLAEAVMLQGDVHGAGDVRPGDAMPRIRVLAQQALDLDPTLAAAHAMLGAIKFTYDFDFAGAARDTRRATELDPASPLAWDYHGLALALTGRFDEAVAAGRRAIELDPVAPWILTDLSSVLYLARDWDGVRAAATAAIELDPDLAVAIFNAGDASLFLGDDDAALAHHERVLTLEPDDPIYQGLVSITYARTGRRDEAVRVLSELRELRNSRYVSPRAFAAVYLALDSLDLAIDWFIRGAETHAPSLAWDVLSPHADVLRQHPRFPELLRLMRLEQ